MSTDNKESQVSDLLPKHYYAIIEGESELQDYYEDLITRYKHQRSIETKHNVKWLTTNKKGIDITRFKDCPSVGFDTIIMHKSDGGLCPVVLGIRTTNNEVYSDWATVGYESKTIGSVEGDELIIRVMMGLPWLAEAKHLERLKATQLNIVRSALDKVSELNDQLKLYQEAISRQENIINDK